MRSIVFAIILVLGSLGEKAFKSFDKCFGFGALGEKAFNSFGNYFGLGGIGREGVQQFW